MVAVCLSFFQKRETSVTSTKHHQQNTSQKFMAIFSIGPRWGKIRNCWSLWRSTPWRKQKLVPKLCMRTISLPCVAWKCLIGDSAGVFSGRGREKLLFVWICLLSMLMCLFTVHLLTDFSISWIASSLHLVLTLQGYNEPVYPTLWATDFMRS